MIYYGITAVLGLTLICFYFWVVNQAGKTWAQKRLDLFLGTLIALVLAILYFSSIPREERDREDAKRFELEYQNKLPKITSACQNYREGRGVQGKDAWWLGHDYSYCRDRRVVDVAKSLGMSYEELAKLLEDKNFVIRRNK